MKFLFDNPSFSFEALRAAGFANYGGADLGEILVTARAIPHLSSRRDKPFVEVACGALPESLLESELFGHVTGAFTGASQDKVGKFLLADGGTLFLDEVATASPGLQVKLLRVLQDHEFEPVGGNKTHKVDVRLVVATNCDLEAMVRRGEFVPGSKVLYAHLGGVPALNAYSFLFRNG